MTARLHGRDQRALVEWAEERGWSWRWTGSGHLEWRHPRVHGAVHTPGSPRANGWHKERQKLSTALARGIAGVALIARAGQGRLAA